MLQAAGVDAGAGNTSAHIATHRVAQMSYFGVAYAAVVLLGYDPWPKATSKTKRLEHLLLLAVMHLLLVQGAVVLLAAVVVL